MRKDRNPIVLGSEITFVQNNHLIQGNRWQIAFEFPDSEKDVLLFDGSNFKRAVYKVKLRMYLMDEVLEINEIRYVIDAYGEFHLDNLKSDVNEADLWGCLKYLTNKMEDHINSTKVFKQKFRAQLERAQLQEELYAFLVKWRKS